MGRYAGITSTIAVLTAALTILVATGAGASDSAPAAAVIKGAGDAEPEPWRSRKRPGCRRFCQQAGGYGQGEPFEDQSVDIPAQTVGPPRNRVVRMTGTCNLDVECVGAIILSSSKLEFGRADLRMPPLATSVVKVAISREALEYLDEQGPKGAKAGIQLNTGDPDVLDLSLSGRLTLLSP